MKRKKNGFVLAETLIVVILLTITLMSLYTTFSTIVFKSRSRSYDDTIDTIYKTSFVKDLLDNNYAHSLASKDYSNTITYYAMNSTNKCASYDYSTGMPVPFHKDQSRLIVCNYESYLDKGESDPSDPMYDIVKSYRIEKMYLINFDELNSSSNNKAFLNLDASTIDYALGRNKNKIGQYLVVKYRKPHVYPKDHMIVENFETQFDVYHSSIRLNSVERVAGTAPIMLYSSTESNAEVDETEPFADGEDYKFNSAQKFKGYAGQVIAGWVNQDAVNNDSSVTTIEGFEKCLREERTDIICKKNGEIVKVNDKTRVFYAVWCGDGSLSDAISCQAKYNISSTDGAFVDGTNYVYRGTGGDNFVRIGDICYSLVSNFGSSDSMKIMYYGTYDTVNENCNIKSNYSPNNTTDFSGPHINSYNWMSIENVSSYPIKKFGNNEDLSQKLGIFKVHKESVKDSTPCKYNSWCYFGDKVVYDSTTKKYRLINEDGSTPTQQQNFASYYDSEYTELNKKFGGKYVCAGGASTTCEGGNVYYFKNITQTQSTVDGVTVKNYYTLYYEFSKGYDFANYQNVKIHFASSISSSYNSSNNTYTYTLGNNTKDITLKELLEIQSNKQLMTDLRTYKYMCNDFVTHPDGSGYTCDSAILVLNTTGYGSYIDLTNGMTTWTEKAAFLNGTVDGSPVTRTYSVSLKQKLDTFYEQKLKASEDIIDKNATFCNNLNQYANVDRVEEMPINDFKYTSQFEVFYKRDEKVGKYNECPYEFLYSVEDASSGNHRLKYPIGLLTYEEASYVAQNRDKLGKNHYLTDTNGTYFLFTPAYIGNITSSSGVDGATWYGFGVDSGGNFITGLDGYSFYRAKPVIAIKTNVKVNQGNGAYNNPFVLG